MCAALAPLAKISIRKELIEVLNGYFTDAVKAISPLWGLTDKFMGMR
ncbi:MAG: hypothetical protein M5U34_10345 [Chloroflexi bacterium]|nr:hypothetical protein [Chloroflexota bacterium]